MHKTLHFERRPGEAHWKKPDGKAANQLSMVLIPIMIALLLLSSFWMMGIENLDDFRQALAIAASGSGASQQLIDEAQQVRQPEWKPGLLVLPLGYLLMAALVPWLERCVKRRYFMILEEGTLTQTHRALWGKGSQRMDWQIPLREIAAAEITAGPLSPLPWMMQLHVTRLNGIEHKIDIANWFKLGGDCLPPLKPVGGTGFFHSPMGLWMKPENQKLLAEAAMELPLVRALRERGVVVSAMLNDARPNDLFASRAVKLGICAGLGLVVLALALMVTRMHPRFIDGVPLWVYPGVAVALILAYLRVASTDEWRPPVAHHFIGFTLLAAGASIAVSPLALLINGLGVPALELQAFVVRDGHLEARDAPLGAERIELPGKQSRSAWLKEGTEVRLEVKQGRLGLWEYDDTPLRDAADVQGIR